MGIFYESFVCDADFQHPEDMKAIMDYLNAHGRVKCTSSRIEDLYYDFSDEEYFAGWMDIVSSSGQIGELGQNLLKEFERWLDRQR